MFRLFLVCSLGAFLIWLNILLFLLKMNKSSSTIPIKEKHFCTDCMYDQDGNTCKYYTISKISYITGQSKLSYKHKYVSNSDGECTSWKPKENRI